jgi:hypothetical protein
MKTFTKLTRKPRIFAAVLHSLALTYTLGEFFALNEKSDYASAFVLAVAWCLLAIFLVLYPEISGIFRNRKT